MLLLRHAQQRMFSVMAERIIHSAYINNKTACKVCFEKLSEIKPYLRNDGLKQRFRTMHRDRFSDSLLTDTECVHNTAYQKIARRWDTNKSLYLIQFANHEYEKVCSKSYCGIPILVNFSMNVIYSTTYVDHQLYTKRNDFQRISRNGVNESVSLLRSLQSRPMFLLQQVPSRLPFQQPLPSPLLGLPCTKKQQQNHYYSINEQLKSSSLKNCECKVPTWFYSRSKSSPFPPFFWFTTCCYVVGVVKMSIHAN